jgi:DNA polymerase I-like protein with 3'-5' exonuclease and polymerase domains
LRQAIAYIPQSTIGDLLNLGLLKIWKDLKHVGIDILGQVHDAVLGQCNRDEVDTLMPMVLEKMNNPIVINEKKMTIPSSIEVGHTWKDMKPWMK